MQYSVSVLPLASLCGVESMDSDYRLGGEMCDVCLVANSAPLLAVTAGRGGCQRSGAVGRRSG